MGKQVVKWLSDDGLEFQNERSMRVHEFNLKTSETVSLFIERFYGGKEDTRYKRFKKIGHDLIMAWEMARIEHSLGTPEPLEVQGITTELDVFPEIKAYIGSVVDDQVAIPSPDEFE